MFCSKSSWLVLFGVALFTAALFSENQCGWCDPAVHVFQPPVGDRWHYPFNFSPGTRPTASIFWNNGRDFPIFNKRDGYVILRWNTSSLIPSGNAPESYLVEGCTVTVFNVASATWTLDGLNSDGVQKRLEMFGVGFTDINPETWVESTAYVGGNVGGPVPAAQRDPYPLDLATQGHAEDSLNALPWALGTLIGYNPPNQTAPFPIVFTLDTSQPSIRAYIQQSLSLGRLYWIVATPIDAPVMGGSPSSSPVIIMKEGVGSHPGSEAPRMAIELGEQGSSVEKWNFY
ncbi:hypothetical protein HS121_03760 [bacterium]|nr:hypothetical protein [bacterium]